MNGVIARNRLLGLARIFPSGIEQKGVSGSEGLKTLSPMKTPRTAAAPTDCRELPWLLPDFGSRKVAADFSGETLSSAGGVLLWRHGGAGAMFWRPAPAGLPAASLVSPLPAATQNAGSRQRLRPVFFWKAKSPCQRCRQTLPAASLSASQRSSGFPFPPNQPAEAASAPPFPKIKYH